MDQVHFPVNAESRIIENKLQLLTSREIRLKILMTNENLLTKLLCSSYSIYKFGLKLNVFSRLLKIDE